LPVAISRAVAAAASAAGRGHWAAGADVATRISWATGLATGLDQDQLIDIVYRLVGTSLATQESVPAAFAVAAACPGDPWLACRIAASLGGDSDTIAAMTGAICGACHGAGAFPDAARRTVAQVNGLDLDPLADHLLAIRTGVHG
jgi:ADP-ribosylglycohydrolase